MDDSVEDDDEHIKKPRGSSSRDGKQSDIMAKLKSVVEHMGIDTDWSREELNWKGKYEELEAVRRDVTTIVSLGQTLTRRKGI